VPRSLPGHVFFHFVDRQSAPGRTFLEQEADALATAKPDETIGMVLGKRGRPKKGEEKKGSERTIKRGENAAYLKARLARDRPDVLEGRTPSRRPKLGRFLPNRNGWETGGSLPASCVSKWRRSYFGAVATAGRAVGGSHNRKQVSPPGWTLLPIVEPPCWLP